MKLYIDLSTQQYPLTEQEIKALNPNTSFPLPFSPGDGYAEVVAVAHPTFDPATHRLQEGVPELVGGWSIKASHLASHAS